MVSEDTCATAGASAAEHNRSESEKVRRRKAFIGRISFGDIVFLK
jgi:hypothetical protein